MRVDVCVCVSMYLYSYDMGVCTKLAHKSRLQLRRKNDPRRLCAPLRLQSVQKGRRGLFAWKHGCSEGPQAHRRRHQRPYESGVWVCVRARMRVAIDPSVYEAIDPSVFELIYESSVNLSIYLSIYIYISIFVCLCVCVCVCLSVCLSICLSVCP